MARGKKLSDAQLKKDATARLMSTVAWRAGYYRANPQRFCSEVLNLKLKLFQKILIYMMMCSDCFMFIASRGLGPLSAHSDSNVRGSSAELSEEALQSIG